MKQGKPTTAGMDARSAGKLRKLHGDLRAVGEKAVECVVPSKIEAKARDFLRGLNGLANMELRAVGALGYAIDLLLFTPSMSGQTAIDRAVRTGKVGGAEMEAANLMRKATFRLLEVEKADGEGLLSATDLASNEKLRIFDMESPMARGGRCALRTVPYQGVHVAFGPMTPLDDDLLAVAAPFIDAGRGLKKPLRCAEALYEHFIRHGALDLDMFADDEEEDDEFPFDASDGPLHALASEWAQASQLPEPDANALQLIRSESYEIPVMEMHRAAYLAKQCGHARLTAAYERILCLQLETVHRRAGAGIRRSHESLDSLTAKLKAGQAAEEIPADAVAHFEEMCRRAKLTGSAISGKGNRDELDKVLSRIQALRGKTVEQGCTEAEALLAAAKVAELLDQYGLTLSEIGVKEQSCTGEGIETTRRRRSPLDDCAGTIAIFCDCRSWYELTSQGNIRHIFFGLPADVAGARYLYEKIDEAFESETAAFKRSELYEAHPSAQRRSATASFQTGLGEGIRAKLDRLKAERDKAFRSSGGRDLVPLKRNVIEDELAAMGMRLRIIETGRKKLLANAYQKGRITGEKLEWHDKIAAA